MLQANNSKELNQAARIAQKFLASLGFKLSHTQGLTLVARMLGYPHHMAAQAAVRAASSKPNPMGDSARMMQAENEALTALLCTATSALRDLHMGWSPKEVSTHGNGTGLGNLVKELVTQLRGRGENDEGGWDCTETEGIPVAAKSNQPTATSSGPRITATFRLEEDTSTRTIDVTAWFEQATIEELRDLHGDGYDGNEARDVFDQLIDCNQPDAVSANEQHCKVNELFPGADIGFDFLIDDSQVKGWMALRHASLFEELFVTSRT